MLGGCILFAPGIIVGILIQSKADLSIPWLLSNSWHGVLNFEGIGIIHGPDF